MPGKLRIILGTHNHLSLGLDEAAAEKHYQEAFKPLLAVLYRYPSNPVTLHYSGILMEWLEEAHPEFLTLLGEMVKRGQVTSCDPVSDGVLARILEGAEKTDELPNECRALLESQGLIEG